MRILVIDDDPDLLTLCRINLARDGHDVVEASNGWQGLELLSLYDPDVVLLDLMMPSLDGFDVLRRIRDDAATHDLPVIIVSARVGMIDQNHGWRAGADGYITKPFNPETLATALRDVERRRVSRPVPIGRRSLRH